VLFEFDKSKAPFAQNAHSFGLYLPLLKNLGVSPKVKACRPLEHNLMAPNTAPIFVCDAQAEHAQEHAADRP
jgi:hypothetical protein